MEKLPRRQPFVPRHNSVTLHHTPLTMKKILSLLVAAFVMQPLQANELIRFSEAKWSEVQAQSAKEKKYVFLDCYTDWCYWCKVMDKETFMDTSVTNFINANFIPTKREMEKDDEGQALSMKYHINGFPTYCIFNAEGLLVYKIVGYREPTEFLKELKAGLAATKGLIPGFSAQLDPGFPQFYKESFGTGKKRKIPETKVVTDFLDSQKDLFTEVCWSVMWRFTLNEKYETWIMENRAKLSELYTAEEVDYKLVAVFMGRNAAAAEKKDDAAFKANMEMFEKYVPGEAKSYRLSMSAGYYQKSGNWKAYTDLIQSDFDTSGTKHDSFINGCAWTIYEECDDKYAIEKAINWMSSICARTDDYAYEDTYAAVLYKGGQYKKAEEVALHAIDLGKEQDEDVSGTEALLANIRLKIK